MFCPGNFLGGGRIRLVNDVNLCWMNGPFPIKTHSRTHLSVPVTRLIVTNCQCHPINNCDTSRTSSSDAFSLGIVVIKELLATQLLSAYVACEINQSEDQASHAWCALSNLLGMQDSIGGFDQYLELDTANLKAHILFDLRQETINKENIFWAIALGNDYNVYIVSSSFDHLYQVSIKVACANIVRTKGPNFPLEVQRIEGLHNRFARFDLLRDGTGILQVEHDLVSVGYSSLRHHLHTVSRHRKFRATYHKVTCHHHLRLGWDDIA